MQANDGVQWHAAHIFERHTQMPAILPAQTRPQEFVSSCTRRACYTSVTVACILHKIRAQGVRVLAVKAGIQAGGQMQWHSVSVASPSLQVD